MKNDSILGDFDIETIVDGSFRIDYEKLLSVYDFQQQKSKPGRVTATSSNCLDHLNTRFQVQIEAKSRTISHHSAIFSRITSLTNEPKHQQSLRKTKDLREIERDKAPNYLFLLDRKTKQNKNGDTIHVDKLLKSILACVDRFATGRILASG